MIRAEETSLNLAARVTSPAANRNGWCTRRAGKYWATLSRKRRAAGTPVVSESRWSSYSRLLQLPRSEERRGGKGGKTRESAQREKKDSDSAGWGARAQKR